MSERNMKQKRQPLKEEIENIIHAGKNIGKMYEKAGKETAKEYRETTKNITKKFIDTF